jgi:hypothetical protein
MNRPVQFFFSTGITILLLFFQTGVALGQPAYLQYPLKITNQSGLSICTIKISLSSATEWGDNWLENGQKLASGFSITYPLDDDTYDVFIKDCNNSPLLTRYNIQVSRTSGITVKSPLQQRDTPPENVNRQLASYDGRGGGGGGECNFSARSKNLPCKAEITGTIVFSFTDFSSKSASSIHIDFPDGRYINGQFTGSYYQLYIGIGSPYGEYTFKAQQGSNSVRGSFHVSAPDSIVATLNADKTPIGVDIAGLLPNSSASLYVYKRSNIHIVGNSGMGYTVEEYLTSIGPFSANNRGELQTSISRSNLDSPGFYKVTTKNNNFIGEFTVPGNDTGNPVTLGPMDSCGTGEIDSQGAVKVFSADTYEQIDTFADGDALDLLCVSSYTDSNKNVWTYIRYGSLAALVNASYIQLDTPLGQ